MEVQPDIQHVPALIGKQSGSQLGLPSGHRTYVVQLIQREPKVGQHCLAH
jgi:hypothetical protein